MKSIIILSVFFIVANSYLINLGSWTATSNNKFSNMSHDEKKQYFGALRHPFGASDEPLVNLPDNDIIPVNFDVRYKWPTCIHPIKIKSHVVHAGLSVQLKLSLIEFALLLMKQIKWFYHLKS